VIELLEQGGPTMIPLLVCSVLAVAVTLERLWALRRRRVLPPELVEEVRGFSAGDHPVDAAERAALRRAAEERPSALATVVRALLTRGASREVAVEAAQGAGRRAVRDLDRGLLVLEIVAAISPLLGLFGTVLGMFETFQVIAEQGLGDPGALSGGISEALITTIFGLGVAIPTVVAQGYLARRVDDLVLDVEAEGDLLLARLHPDAPPVAAPPVPAEAGEAR
jgi:biopolymer transport protein ExbB